MYNIYNIDEYEESNGVVLTLMTSAKETNNTEKNIEKTQAMISAALLGVTAVGLIVTWIAFGQTPLRMLPLFVSLVVGMLQAGANRYGCLIGGINSIIYTIVYLMLGIYGSAAQALLVSCPFQLVTFARWSRHKYKNSTEFRRMSGKARIISFAGLAVCYALTLAVLTAAGSGYSLLDGATSILGVATSVLTLLSYIEYTWLMLISGVLGIALNIAMAIDMPEMVTYVVFSVYSFICVTRQFFSVRRIYTEQKNQKTERAESE